MSGPAYQSRRVEWIGAVFTAALVAALAAGCALRSGDPVVDGWAIGGPFDCSEHIRSGLPCQQEVQSLVAVAIAGFDKRDPAHAQVIDVTIHEEGVVYDVDGNAILTTRSGGCCDVARIVLADGGVRAIGVGYPGVSEVPIAVDYGPN